MSPEVKEAFRRLREAFTIAPVLRHFDPKKPIRIETDASGFALVGIISQQDDPTSTRSHWHPVAFWSRKMIPTECNYDTHNYELLAIVVTFK